MTPGVVTQVHNRVQRSVTTGIQCERPAYGIELLYGGWSLRQPQNAGNGRGQPQAGATGTTAGGTALGTTQSLVSVDAFEEFRVISSSYSAEYGPSPGNNSLHLQRGREPT